MKLQKNHGVESNQDDKDQRMYSQPHNQNCPVASLKLYLEKLSPDEEHLFQTPRKVQKGIFGHGDMV